MNSCELAAFISSVACTLFKNLTTDDLTLLAAILVQLGDTLEAMLVNEELCQKNNSFKEGTLQVPKNKIKK